jgi:(4S)-4-hydroxy-5-phosphonooxypentane-2,3-dione isomerase
MLVVHVYVHVKEASIEPFKAATIENARQSVQEEGIVRFDVVQQEDDPSRFILVEAYLSEDAPAKHKATVHYNVWRETVASMMAEPRTNTKSTNVFPADSDW